MQTDVETCAAVLVEVSRAFGAAPIEFARHAIKAGGNHDNPAAEIAVKAMMHAARSFKIDEFTVVNRAGDVGSSE